MECGDAISFDSILRRVIRFKASQPNCAAIAYRNGADIGPIVCGVDGLLTEYAKTIDQDQVRVIYSQEAFTFDLVDCDSLPGLLTLAMSVLRISETRSPAITGTAIEVIEALPAVVLVCEQECDDAHIGTLERVMRSFVKTPDGDTPYAVQVTVVDMEEPMDCDRTLSFLTLVNMVLAPVGDGSYTWRITA